MESSCSLHSPTVTTISSSLSRPGFNVKPSGYAQFLRFSSSKRYSHARKLKFLDLRAQASGTAKIRSEAVEAVPKKENSKDEDLAFVAGATGRVGSRTVRELLKLGFRVRAGVRSAQRAQSLLESVKQMKLENASDGTQPVEKLEIVECDLEKQDRIVPALGNASVVICCIGASEKEVADFTGPYRIDYQATKNLVDAATVAKVNHFVLVTSLGTNKVGFPAVLLNLFWGVLIWKRKAEEALIASGLPYTIVRPGGMERPTDAYKETHNITLSEEDTLFGGQVSNLQIAELIACMAKNPGLSYCKVVEAIAETTAPLTPMEELLAKIPSQRANIYSPKESTGADEPDPATSKGVISVEPSTTVDKKPVQSEAAAAPQLSPYTTYEDLKPLTSPTPTPSTTAAATETTLAPEEQGKTRPLSPYAAYEDLKPPSSPSPTASRHSSASAPVENASSLSGNDVATIVSGVVRKDGSSATIDTKPAQADGTAAKPLSPYTVFEDLKPPTSPIPTPSTKASPTETTLPQEDQRRLRPLSPYAVYDDLKPPSSPSPTAPSALLQSATTSNSTVPPPLADKPSNEQHAPSKPRPLSPYAMYEDLKPPTSPVPVPSKS